jgi:hypothetical protein
MKYDAHNTKVFTKVANKWVKNVYRPALLSTLCAVAQTIVDYVNGVPIDGTDDFPRWSSNMLDSTGVAVYCDGRVYSFIPTKKATERQHAGAIKDIDGNVELQNAIALGQTRYNTGIWIVLFSAVPYACDINTFGSRLGRGAGYFTSLKSMLLNTVLTGLKPIE